MDVKQFKEYIVTPTLKEIRLYSESAEQLVLGTAVYESGGLKYIHQIGGPALGVCQMEPATHDDIWKHYLKYQPDLTIELNKLCDIGRYDSNELMYNLRYAVAMCRIQYFRRPEALPAVGDYIEQAKYYKKFYNTYKGKGTVGEYLVSYSAWVLQDGT